MAIANALQLIIINKTIVPADLRSAGIEYKDLQIRLKYRCFTKVSKARKKIKSENMNAKLAENNMIMTELEVIGQFWRKLKIKSEKSKCLSRFKTT